MRFKWLFNTKPGWVTWGLVVGLIFGLAESHYDYELSLVRFVPILNHAFWTAIVAGGIWLSMQASEWKPKLLRLLIPFTAAVVLHGVWNSINHLALGTPVSILSLAVLYVILKNEGIVLLPKWLIRLARSNGEG